MSASRKKERNRREDKNSSQEAGIGLFVGILQGIQTSLADLSAPTKSQSAAFQSLHEDLLLREDSSDEHKDNDSGETTIMDKSVDTFEQNKRFLSASLRKFQKHFFTCSLTPSPPFQCSNTLR